MHSSPARPLIRSVVAALVVAFAFALAVGAAAPLANAARSTACPPSSVRVTIDGSASCRPARGMAPIRTTTESDATFVARRMLGVDGFELPVPTLRGNRRFTSAYTPAQLTRIEAAMRELGARGLATARAAVDPSSSAARRAVRTIERAAPAGVVISEPTYTVDGRSASVKVAATVNDGAGSTTKISLGLDARIGQDGAASADMTFGVERTDAQGVSKGTSFTAGLLGKDADFCPDARGYIRYSEPYKVSSTETLSERLGPISSGTLTTIRNASASSSGTGRLEPNAMLAPIPFRVTGSATLAMKGDGLIGAIGGVIGGFYTMTGTATGAGTIDPKTGAILANSRFNVTTAGTGAPALRALAAKRALDEARAMVGRQYDHFRAVEKNARTGKCTLVQLEPGSGQQLAPGSSASVRATMRLREGAQAVVTKPVTWTITPAHGSVSPRTSTDNGVATKVTGAGPKAGRTALVTYKAVSRAGISTVTWEGLDSPFPKHWGGAMSYRTDYGGTIESGTANVRFTLKTATSNPDGSKTAWYEVESATVTSSELSTFTTCQFLYGPTDPGAPQTIKSGDVEVDVTPAGQWTIGAQLDIDLGTRHGTGQCPPPQTPPPYDPNVKFVMNTRTYTGSLQPIAARGTFTASGLAAPSFPVGSSTGSWTLAPFD